MTKMTYAVAIDRAIVGDVDAEVGLTKTQKEGLELMERIVEVLADAEDGMTATEVGDAVEVTCQRASALLKKLVEDERVRKDKVGKQVRFFLA